MLGAVAAEWVTLIRTAPLEGANRQPRHPRGVVGEYSNGRQHIRAGRTRRRTTFWCEHPVREGVARYGVATAAGGLTLRGQRHRPLGRAARARWGFQVRRALE